MTNPNYSLSQEKQPLIHGYINFIFFFMLLLTMCINFSNIIVLKNTDSSYLKSLGKNWKSSSLNEINFKGKTCEKNETPIIQDDWRGTEEGCACQMNSEIDSPNNSTKVFTGKCRNDLLDSKQCKNIPSIPNKPFTMWKGSNLCGQVNNKTYFDYDITDSVESCINKNLKPCGIIDTQKNILCIPQDTECPYNFVEKLNYIEEQNLEKYNLNNKTNELDGGFLLKNFSNYESRKNIEETYIYLINKNNSNLQNISDFLFKENNEKSGVISTNDINSTFYFTILNYMKNLNSNTTLIFPPDVKKINKLKQNLKISNNSNINNLAMSAIPIEFILRENAPCAYKGQMDSSDDKNLNNQQYPLDKNESPKCNPVFTNNL
jgi:hypothetical protein